MHRAKRRCPRGIVPARVGPLPAEAIVRWNPLTQFVEASRSIFYLLELPDRGTSTYLVVASAVSLVVGWLIFERASLDVVEQL